MAKETLNIHAGNFIISDPNYFYGLDYYHLFWTGGDGGFYDNYNNEYYVDSAKLAIYQVYGKPKDLPKGTHYFSFKKPWTIEFDPFHDYEQITITMT